MRWYLNWIRDNSKIVFVLTVIAFFGLGFVAYMEIIERLDGRQIGVPTFFAIWFFITCISTLALLIFAFIHNAIWGFLFFLGIKLIGGKHPKQGSIDDQ